MRKTIFSGLIAALLLAALLSLPVLAQVSNFTSVTLSGDLIVGDDATVTDSLSTADIAVSDDATVTDDLTTADLYLTQQSTQTIGYQGTITPTGTYHQIAASAARGTSSVAGVSTAGRVITLINVGAQTITLTDTGTLKLSGNAALGQYDSLVLISDGTNWIQVSKTDN